MASSDAANELPEAKQVATTAETQTADEQKIVPLDAGASSRSERQINGNHRPGLAANDARANGSVHDTNGSFDHDNDGEDSPAPFPAYSKQDGDEDRCNSHQQGQHENGHGDESVASPASSNGTARLSSPPVPKPAKKKLSLSSSRARDSTSIISSKLPRPTRPSVPTTSNSSTVSPSFPLNSPVSLEEGLDIAANERTGSVYPTDSTDLLRLGLLPMDPTNLVRIEAEPLAEHPTADAAVAVPPPLPPPPYWTHSLAISQDNNVLESGLLVATHTPAATNSAATHSNAAPTRSPASKFSAPSLFLSGIRRTDPGSSGPFSSGTTASSSFLFSSRPPTASSSTLSSASRPSSSRNGLANHRRDTSSSSSTLNLNLITLQDNEAPDHDENGEASAPASRSLYSPPGQSPSGLTSSLTSSSSSRCWARRVDITDYVIVNGAGAGRNLGAFTVWTIRVETLEGGSFSIHKRYSEFDALRRQLVASFPHARAATSTRRAGALPPLPPKSVLGKFRPAFLEQRRLGLQYFLNCILLNPEFSGSPILRDFLFEK